MADKFTRTIELDDKELMALVVEKGEIVEKGRAIAQEMEELAKAHKVLEDRHNECFAKLNKKKLEIVKRIKKVASKELGEYEVPVTTEIVDGKLMFEIADSLAEYQDSFKRFDKWQHAAPPKKK